MAQLGIHKKITYGFYLILFITAISAILTFSILNLVERQVAFGEVIEDFFNTTLEVRRFEKNFFLYHQEKDFQENQSYWLKIREIFETNSTALRMVVSSTEIQRLDYVIADYDKNMRQLHEYTQRPRHEDEIGDAIIQPQELIHLEELVRGTGKELTEFGEKTRNIVKQKIKTLLKKTLNNLLISMVCLLIAAVVFAAFLGKKVVNSLKMLEGYIKIISQGEFVEITVGAGEPEIRSLLTAFNRMTKELQIRQHQLVQSEKLAALGTLLSGVAHELNNPLSNISTSAQILGEEIEADDLEFKRNLLAQIETQSDKARDIVKTLLEFSRIKEFKKDSLPLKKLVDDTILLVRGHTSHKVSINLDIPEGLMILADKQRMQQVFLNLIQNGMDAMEGTGNIWISALGSGCSSGNDEVEILIEDDGPGIQTEYVEKIFDPFFTTKDVGKGSGLGLFIVHDIIEWHGGSITVDSRPGFGTTFIIWLPGEQRDCKI
jgi:two-component system, NtrC family, sensor kinase